MRIYYAHCTSLFDTPQEKRDILLLEGLGFEVYNPNNDTDSEGYKKHGMIYFKELVQRFQALAFRATPSGLIPAGVFREILWARGTGAFIIELPSGILSREMDVPITRQYLQEIGQR